MSAVLPSGRDRRDKALGALDATVPATSADETLVLLVHDTPTMKGPLGLLLSDEGFRLEAMAVGEFGRHAVDRESGGEKAADHDSEDEDGGGDNVSEAILDTIRARRPALVLLHIARQPERGFRLVERISEAADEPLIVLSPQAAPADRARGLRLGADDYLATPFDPDELTARVRAVLRRSDRHTSRVPPLVIGNLTIDFERRVLTRDGTVVPLGRTEWLLLRHLARYPGKVVLNTELLSAIWGEGYADDLQVLRICISRLRHKLGAERRGGGPIRTFHNVGYALETEG